MMNPPGPIADAAEANRVRDRLRAEGLLVEGSYLQDWDGIWWHVGVGVEVPIPTYIAYLQTSTIPPIPAPGAAVKYGTEDPEDLVAFLRLFQTDPSFHRGVVAHTLPDDARDRWGFRGDFLD